MAKLQNPLFTFLPKLCIDSSKMETAPVSYGILLKEIPYEQEQFPREYRYIGTFGTDLNIFKKRREKYEGQFGYRVLFAYSIVLGSCKGQKM